MAAGVPYYGATVGRYANRIAKARFALDGKTYQLDANDGPNTLHGGKRGFDKRIWKAEEIPAAKGGGVRMTLVSAAGDVGRPLVHARTLHGRCQHPHVLYRSTVRYGEASRAKKRAKSRGCARAGLTTSTASP